MCSRLNHNLYYLSFNKKKVQKEAKHNQRQNKFLTNLFQIVMVKKSLFLFKSLIVFSSLTIKSILTNSNQLNSFYYIMSWKKF